ncbi:NAD(P)/FAD-dependent oxidoreductase [Nocardiopsis sp. CNT312]|uniref:NAD(P)/FAD-dependent oxidoreductase n=1 Tax=Nocardiopsis sp. CNT312 TaxID=1137268 RepID=UPI00048B36EE|nr:NAD(P)/FAD-dependent oxidoreductase [Nocardiopsis sp. CNT312]
MNTQPPGSAETYDVIVVGGGAAGLSAALTLGRARRSVLVVDSGLPRNAPADGLHAYLGREGTAPEDFLRTARTEVAGYGVRVTSGEAVSASREEEGFRVALAAGGSALGRRLLVATGLVDELPELPGLSRLWGRSVIHCPYCHGWEVRDRRIGVLSTGPFSLHQAFTWHQWSPQVTLFTHTGPEPGDEDRERLAALGITVVSGKVTALEEERDELRGVRLEDGRVVSLDVLSIAPRFTVHASFLEPLGLKPVEEQMHGHTIGEVIRTDPTGATGVPGVWAAGNVTSPMEQVIGAASAGNRVAAAINTDLIMADTAAAVAARSSSG